MRGERRRGGPRRKTSEVRLGRRDRKHCVGRRPFRPLGPLPDNPSSPGAATVAAEKLYRASNHHLAKFHFHLDGRPIGKLAARAAGTAYAKLAGHLRQRSARRLSSRPDSWRRNLDVLRYERYGLDVDRKSPALSSLSLLQPFTDRARRHPAPWRWIVGGSGHG